MDMWDLLPLRQRWMPVVALDIPWLISVGGKQCKKLASASNMTSLQCPSWQTPTKSSYDPTCLNARVSQKRTLLRGWHNCISNRSKDCRAAHGVVRVRLGTDQTPHRRAHLGVDACFNMLQCRVPSNYKQVVCSHKNFFLEEPPSLSIFS